MSSITAPEDIRARWVGGDAPDDDDLLEQLIADAEGILHRRLPQLQERLDADTLDVETVQMVVARMVTRHLRNPEGIRQVQETTGPFAGSRTYGGDTPGALTVTDEDRRDLGFTRGRAFTIGHPQPPGWIGG